MSEAFGVFFKPTRGGWFEFGLTDQEACSSFVNPTATISFRDTQSAANGKTQIPIVEGHDGGSCFWIMPVRRVPKSQEARLGVEACRQEEISIEEGDVSEFLYYFLDKYFDPDYPYGECRNPGYETGLQWYLEHNFYTYASMEKMLDEIAYFCNLLKTDYENPELDVLKRRFSPYTFQPDLLLTGARFSDEERDAIFRTNIHVATEFYQRFIRRMRAMMSRASDYDFISFMGP